MKGPYGAGEHEMGYDVEDGLRMAVASFPLVVTRLLAKLNDQSVGKGLDWQVKAFEDLRKKAFTNAGACTDKHTIPHARPPAHRLLCMHTGG